MHLCKSEEKAMQISSIQTHDYQLTKQINRLHQQIQNVQSATK